jgi:hypothetical protein
VIKHELALTRESCTLLSCTFGADEYAIERAREVARSEHRSLIDAFREWLIPYGSRRVSAAEVTELYNSLRQ